MEKVYYQDGAVYTIAKLVRPGDLLKALFTLQENGKTFEEKHVASILKDTLEGLGHVTGQFYSVAQ